MYQHMIDALDEPAQPLSFFETFLMSAAIGSLLTLAAVYAI